MEESDRFARLAAAAESGGTAAVFDLLLRECREAKDYPALFEARLMKARADLGLPLIHAGSIDMIPEDRRAAYEAAFIETAKEVGMLFLAAGDIPRAWSYLRAVGVVEPVAEAIDRVAPEQAGDAVLEIAFQEQVNPRRGLELILANHGICRAITCFSGYPGRRGREESLALLTRTLYRDLTASLTRTIAEVEGKAPEETGVSALISGRDWLFEGANYYVDTSHLASVIQFCGESQNVETLRLAIELCDYGAKLAPMFHWRGEAPFDNVYEDYRIWIRALIGEDLDSAIAHFRAKAAAADPEETGTAPAQALVNLLTRLGRYSEAIDVSLEHLSGADLMSRNCPTVTELCQMNGDWDKLAQVAQSNSDPMAYVAALVARLDSKQAVTR